MESLLHYIAPPSPCGYLPDQLWSLEYEAVAGLTAAEYQARLLANWRRFGGMLFRPRCPRCNACRSLRVLVDRFRPNRSQRRCAKLNAQPLELRIGTPTVSADKLRLYDRYHAFQTEDKDWLFSERYYGRFERRIPVEDVDEDKISASFKNGVLTVTLPKAPQAQSKVKRIAINGK